MIGAVGAVATFAAMVATPLARPGGTVRRRAASVVVGGLAVSTFARLRVGRSPERAAGAAAALVTLGWVAERIGTSSGRPFGRYDYTGALRPRLGGVPVLVPLAWFAMAAPARDAAHAALGVRSTPGRRVAAGAAALTAWDLFLDPQMTAEGYWRWHRSGRYRGVPLSNFGGWLLVSVVAMAVLESIAPPDEDADAGLVGEYAGVAVMETLGHAAFFRDRVVALVGGVGMLPVAALAIRRVISRSMRSNGSRRSG